MGRGFAPDFWTGKNFLTGMGGKSHPALAFWGGSRYNGLV